MANLENSKAKWAADADRFINIEEILEMPCNQMAYLQLSTRVEWWLLKANGLKLSLEWAGELEVLTSLKPYIATTKRGSRCPCIKGLVVERSDDPSGAGMPFRRWSSRRS